MNLGRWTCAWAASYQYGLSAREDEAFIALRAGISLDRDGELNVQTFGLGLKYNRIQIDVAYVIGNDQSPMDDNVRYSMNLLFLEDFLHPFVPLRRLLHAVVVGDHYGCGRVASLGLASRFSARESRRTDDDPASGPLICALRRRRLKITCFPMTCRRTTALISSGI